ncbi:hypothetical protein PVIIG_06163 [Plasmodium vivax India VII]|uniref:VIR protein n=1 Tax=Plasmodium vivax India VII TaxID=1077284 RepID=A0A0J9V8S6_PLAVI|nr:hypothetical protein PVIIG_06163 [Plasmodium vivax India VII]
MFNYLGDDELKYLQTIHNYGKLDNGRDHCKYYPFYDAAQRVLDSYYLLKDDSDKILRALCYVYKNSVPDNLYSDMCNFLYFWLGKLLLEKLVTKNLFHEVILDLFKILTNAKNHQICQLPHYYMNSKEFQDFKSIFDCSEDYKTYCAHLLIPGMPCNNKYKTHLERNKEIYKKFYDECEIENKGYEYCKAFREYFPNKKSNLLSQFNCRLEAKNPTVYQLEEDDIGAQELPQEGQMIGKLQRNEKFSAVSEIGVSPVQHPSSPDSYVNRVDSQMGGNLINKLLGRTTRTNHNPLMEEQLINNFYQPEQFNAERSGYNISYRPV